MTVSLLIENSVSVNRNQERLNSDQLMTKSYHWITKAMHLIKCNFSISFICNDNQHSWPRLFSLLLPFILTKHSTFSAYFSSYRFLVNTFDWFLLLIRVHLSISWPRCMRLMSMLIVFNCWELMIIERMFNGIATQATRLFFIV